MVFTRTSLRYVRVFAIKNPSVCRLSVCDVRAPYSGVGDFGIFRAKLYGDRLRKTPPSGALNTTWVAK